MLAYGNDDDADDAAARHRSREREKMRLLRLRMIMVASRGRKFEHQNVIAFLFIASIFAMIVTVSDCV